MQILIAKLAALGDVLRTTSLLRPLRARHPGCRVTWVTTPAARPLLEGNPLIDELLTVPEARAAGWRGRFDLVLSLEEDAELASLGRTACRGELVGVTDEGGGRLGYTKSAALYYDMSLLNRDADGGLSKANALKAANRLTYAELWLKVLGLPVPADRETLRPQLVLADADREAARALCRARGWPGKPGALGLNPGAGTRWPAKQLSIAQAAGLLNALAPLGRPLLTLGGADEAERNAEIVRLAGPPAVDPGCKHPLRAFAGLVELCDAVVATDSLAFHIATALGKPVVVLVGPTSPTELDVFGRGRIVFPEGGCSCFYKARCSRETSCLDALAPGPLADAVRACLSPGRAVA